ncbi:sugar transferase [Opitutaceae bacterium TAV4]|nr:sugar transferase [Opitutaceae bacterium TAV4]RRK00738.1 sugar transferase [Opitutaceae bacterium TAV3]
MKALRPFTTALIFGDLLSVFVLINFVAILRGITSWHTPLLWPLLVPFLLLLAALHLIDGYNSRTDFLSADYLSQHILACFAATIALLLITFVFVPAGYPLQQSRAVVGLSFLIIAPATLLTRRLLHLKLQRRRAKRLVIYAGADADVFSVEATRLQLDREIRYARLGPDDGPDDGRPLLGDLIEDITSGRLGVEAVVLRETGRSLPPDVSRRLEELYFEGVPTYTLELFHQLYWRKIPLYRLNLTWLFQEGFKMARVPVFNHLKRLSDIALSLFVLVLGAPFIAAAAIAIKWEDGGSVFFKQLRIGRNRVPFTLYKLRTMRPAPEGASSPGGGGNYTAKNDSRITRLGRFLRASRLDELPQLWNVLKGDMSMIGPRAEWDVLVADYERRIACYHFRHLVRPGITGWAQINYPYGAGIDDTLRKLEYDLYYIRHFSFLLDAAIVLKTVHVMLAGKGGR